MSSEAGFHDHPPLMVQTPANPKGLPKKVFDDFQVGSRPASHLPMRPVR
jgi:hypothetical protein